VFETSCWPALCFDDVKGLEGWEHFTRLSDNEHLLLGR